MYCEAQGKRLYMKEKSVDVCVLDEDPNACRYTTTCSYWNKALQKCFFTVIKAREKKKRREQRKDAQDSSEWIKMK